jgi:hypothetical protein
MVQDPGEVQGGTGTLLAVDLGLGTGLALYRPDGRLAWYRSQHFANRATLRRGVAGLLDENPGLARIVVEGGGPLAVAWVREGERRSIPTLLVAAETWRRRLFGAAYDPARAGAKRAADAMARRVIEWSDAPRPTSLRHDAAEAILIGVWGVLECGWLDRLPDGLR